MWNKQAVSNSNIRFFKLFLLRPWVMAAGCGILTLGLASGISTCAILSKSNLFTTNEEASLLAAFFRVFAFNSMLILASQTAVYHNAALPFACGALMIKGVAIGFAVRQLFFEFAWKIASFGAIAAVLSSFPMMTALLVSFAACGAGRTGPADTADRFEERAFCSTLLSFFLCGVSVLLEGCLFPLILSGICGS